MKSHLKALLAGFLTFGALPSATAQVIYSTGFEKPVLLAGTALAGQDGWIAPPPLSPAAAVIAAQERRYRNGQFLRVEGSSLVSQPEAINAATGGYYDAIGSYRHGVDYDTGGIATVRISVDVRLDGRRTPRGNFFSASIAAIGYNAEGGSEGIGELAISSDGHVYGSSGQDLVPAFLTSTHVSLGTWHNLAIEVDFAERAYSFYLDNRWLGTFDFAPTATSNVLRRGSIITYAAPNTGKDKKANHAANFDNFAIEVVSE